MIQERDAEKKPVMDKKTGQPVLKKGVKSVFDARIHSAVGKDIVNEYIELVRKKLTDEGHSDAEVANKMLVIYGQYPNTKGIVGKAQWKMYVKDLNSGEFGRLQIGKAVKQRINELIARESAGEPIGTEATNPFTELDDARALIITYDKSAKKAQDYYKTEIDTSYDKVTKQVKFYPLTDQDLQAFEKQPSLASIYKNSYTKADFDLALEGLRMFDAEHKFGVFESEAFLDIAESLSDLYPEPKTKEEKAQEAVAEVVEGDEFQTMSRAQLTTFARVNKTGLIVKQTMTDDQLRNALREWQLIQDEEEKIEEKEEEEAPFEVQTLEEEEEDFIAVAERKRAEEKAKATPTPAPSAEKPLTARERMARLKGKS
jgi:hypothetical protein